MGEGERGGGADWLLKAVVHPTAIFTPGDTEPSLKSVLTITGILSVLIRTLLYVLYTFERDFEFLKTDAHPLEIDTNGRHSLLLTFL